MRTTVGNLFFVTHPETMLTIKGQVDFFHGFKVTRQTLFVSLLQDRLDQQAADTLLLLAWFHAEKE